MVRATSSLPVPFSPVISTQASRGAAAAISWHSSRVAGLSPLMACFSMVFLRR